MNVPAIKATATAETGLKYDCGRASAAHQHQEPMTVCIDSLGHFPGNRPRTQAGKTAQKTRQQKQQSVHGKNTPIPSLGYVPQTLQRCRFPARAKDANPMRPRGKSVKAPKAIRC